jgi:hypothetical protein
MEWRRRSEDEDQEWEPLQRGWCIGSEEFKKELLEKMEDTLGENHSGELRRESAEAKAERIISEELHRLGWTAADLSLRRKNDPTKLVMADRLRRETVLSVKSIAERLHLGSPKSARARLRERKQTANGLGTRTAQRLN